MVAVPLERLTTADVAIRVQSTVTGHDQMVACGAMANVTTSAPHAGQSRQVLVGLHERNHSGSAGVAVLAPAPGGTEVTIYLTMISAASTPSVGDSGHAQTGVVATVDIRNFAYTSQTIPVGGTITWTNHDTTAHTVTAQDRKIFQSGTIEPGASYTQTFTMPGTYAYFCEFHANMNGTVIVSAGQ